MRTKLKDRFGQELWVDVRASQKGSNITGTKEVLFGKIEGKGKEYTFKIPTKYKRV
jgi:hypothetical protein